MSVPWGWLGNWFPHCDGTPVSLSSTGDGTAYPLVWNNTYGATDSTQICAFEWTTAQLTLSMSGSITASFQNPSPPNNVATASSSFSGSGSIYVDPYFFGGPPPATWDALEPGDYTVPTPGAGGQSFGSLIGSLTSLGMSFSLPWGTVSPALVVYLRVCDLLGILGTETGDGLGWNQYTKFLEVTGVFGLFSGSGGITVVSTNKNTTIIGGPPPPVPPTTLAGSASLLFGSSNIYWGTIDPSGSFSLSSCSLSVSQTFSPPADIA